jgi:voltage-gated potassium channel
MTEHSLQNRLFVIIYGTSTREGKTFDIVLLVMILLSILTVNLETIQYFEENYRSVLIKLEWFFTILFTIEYILRIYSHPHPLKYIFSFLGIIDLLAIVPTYLSFFLMGGQYLVTLRVFRLLRVFRIFKLTGFIENANVLMDALVASSKKIIIFIMVVLSIVLISGTLLYVIEGEERGFSSIPQSIYWSIVTVTTVGYGDITPQTAAGKFIASIIMILGYGIIAVPTGIVSAEFVRGRDRKPGKSQIICANCSKKTDFPGNYCSNCGHAFES